MVRNANLPPPLLGAMPNTQDFNCLAGNLIDHYIGPYGDQLPGVLLLARPAPMWKRPQIFRSSAQFVSEYGCGARVKIGDVSDVLRKVAQRTIGPDNPDQDLLVERGGGASNSPLASLSSHLSTIS